MEDGTPVTAEDVAFGIQRSMDADDLPDRPGPTTRTTFFKDGDSYKGPYTDQGPKCNGVTVNGNDITIKMAKPFPDMDYWGSFPAMGPVPQGKDTNPQNYGKHPLSTGPYKFEELQAR